MIFDELKELIKTELGVEAANSTLATTLQDMGADSLDAAELIMAIEEKYEIQIAEVDAEQFTSLGSIVAYIETKQRGRE